MLIATSTTAGLIVGAYVTSHEFHQARERRELRSRSVRELAEIVQPHLFEFDYQGVRSVALAFAQRADVLGVRVADQFGVEVYDGIMNENVVPSALFELNLEGRDVKVQVELNPLEFASPAGARTKSQSGLGVLVVQFVPSEGQRLVGKAVARGLMAFLVVFAPCAWVIRSYSQRHIVGPLRELHRAIGDTRATGVHVQARIRGQSMFGRLAHEFNSMQVRLARTSDEREGLLAEKKATAQRLNSSLEKLEKESRLRRREAQVLDTVLQTINQSVSYFDLSGRLTVTNVTPETHPLVRGLLTTRFIGEREMIAEIEARGCKFRVLESVSEADPRKNSTVVHSIEAESPAGQVWVFQAIDLRSSGCAIVASEVTSQRRAERKLVQAQKMDALGSLTAGVAHDFNNLLCIVLVNLELLSLGTLSDEDEGLAREAAISATKNAVGVVSALLSYSRRESTLPVDINLSTYFKRLRIVLSATLGPRIELKIDSCLKSKLLVDEDHLTTSLLNLSVNARDAMPEGGTLEISAHRAMPRLVAEAGLETKKVYVAIEVRDTGEGIPKDIESRIFDPFFTTKSPGHGTGLGLAVVYGFAQQASGAILCDSEPGKGTRFTLLIPQLNGERQVGQSPNRPSPNKLPEGLSLLIVEDEQQLLEAMADHLRGLGMRPVEAGSVEAALDILESPEGADLKVVLCDVHLPDGNGLEVGRRVSELSLAAVVILMSGNFEGGVDPDLAAAYSDSVLKKPFGLEALVNAIREVLKP